MATATRKRWVQPSFDSFAGDTPSTKKPATVKKSTFRAPEPSDPLITVTEHKSTTWLEKYQPKHVDDLVVHPKKIKEVEEWFRNHVVDQREKYLLLTGPCGCGKTICLRAVARKFNFDVVEWITPLDRDYDPDLCGDDQTYQSAGEVFEQFLSRATRYPSLLSASKSKIVLVKDFPNVFHQRPDTLHDMLRRYLTLSTYPIAFVCNDDSLARNLLPDALRKECGVRTIQFNPVHCKAVIKALERVLELERQCNASANLPENVDLDAVYRSSAGDLRSAILKLYFNVMAVDDNVRGRVKALRPRRKAAPSAKGKRSAGSVDDRRGGDVNEVAYKDENADLFHLLGRVIYANRHVPDADKPHHLGFVHNPNDLVDACSGQPFAFVSFLQENYASRFSSIANVCRAADSLRRVDVLLASDHKDAHQTGLAMAVRGVMVANERPTKSFRPFVKARRVDDLLRTSFAEEVKRAFPGFEHSARDIALYTLPLLRECSYPFDETQIKVVNRLAASFRK